MNIHTTTHAGKKLRVEWAERNLAAHRDDLLAYGYPKELTETSISVDEKSFYLDGPCKSADYCRWITGDRKPTMEVRTGKGGRVNLVMGVHLGGILTPMELPTTRQRPGERTASENYEYFLLLARRELQDTGYDRVQVIYEDNCKIHTGKKHDAVKLDCDRGGFASILLPPYSPDMNPIEKFFGILTKKVYKGGRDAYRTKDELMAAIQGAVDEMNFRKVGKPSEATIVFNSLMGAQGELWRELVDVQGCAIPATKEATRRFATNEVSLR